MMRTVCDRCHGQKLRCDRDDEAFGGCKRCRKAGAVCTLPGQRGNNSASRMSSNWRMGENIDTIRSNDNEENGVDEQPPNKTRRTLSPQASTNSYIPIPQRPMIESRNKRKASNSFSGLNTEDLNQFASSSSDAQDASNLLGPEFYDDCPPSGSVFNFMSPHYMEELNFEGSSATSLSHIHEEHDEKAWPSSSFAEQIITPSTSNLSYDERKNNHQRGQQSQQWSISSRDCSFTPDAAARNEERAREAPSPSPGTAWSSHNSTSRHCHTMMGRRAVSENKDTKATRLGNSTKLFHMYISLDDFMSTTIPSMTDAFQYTIKLIDIVHDSVSLQKDKFGNQPHNKLVPPDPLNQNRQKTSGNISSGHSNDVLMNNEGGLGDTSVEREKSDVQLGDASIIFLVLGCSFRILRLYQRLIEDVAEKLESAIRHIARPEFSHADMSRELGGKKMEGSAMEWVQIVSSVVHLAAKMDSTIKLFAHYSNENGQVGPRKGTFHDSLESSAIPSSKDDEGKGSLEEVVAIPVKEILIMKGALKNTADNVMNRIRTSELV